MNPGCLPVEIKIKNAHDWHRMVSRKIYCNPGGKLLIFRLMGTVKLARRIATPLLIFVALIGLVSIIGARRSFAVQPRIPLQSKLALADLDGDNLVDKAELGGTGLSKNIQLKLSRSGKSSVLTFDTASLDRGSLLAQDVNDDGEIDLIWTDLVHPDAVVVWLNTGLGGFERAGAARFGDRFTLGGFKFDQPYSANHESSIGLSRVSFGDFLSSANPSRPGPALPQCVSTVRQLRSIALSGPPTDRAPPSV